MVLRAFGVALALAALSSAQPNHRQFMRLTILHTNDIHGHLDSWVGWEGELLGRAIGGFDTLATAVDRVRRQSPNVLLLDAGDAIGDTLAASSTQGHAVIHLMNSLRYDAMTLGNHEPDFGMDVLRSRIAQARFDVVAANVIQSTSRQLLTKPYVLRSIGDVKIGILGLSYPNTPLTTAAKNVAGLEFRQARETASEYVPKLRAEGAVLVVVLSHLGLSADGTLAQSVPGIDVIVGGHSHNRIRTPRHVGDTIIVQAGAHLSDLGRLDLDIADGKVVSSQGQLIVLDRASIPADSTIARQIEQSRPAAGTAVIATARAPIIRAQTLAGSDPRKRDQESPADSLFADLLRRHARADLALLPGVGYGVAIPAGPITVAALHNLVPHDSKLVAMNLTGAELQEILEQSLENVFSDNPITKVGGVLQVSGLSFTYAPARPFGSRIESLTVNRRPVEPPVEFRVVTNSMLAAGGHNYKTFTRGRNRRELSPQYSILEESLRQLKEVSPPPPGRIARSAHR